MRYRLLASYQGAPYEAGIGPDETGVVLFAACPPPEELRFEPATGHWRKEVSRGDVQVIYESRPVGTFRGERCVVLDDLNDRLHIAYLGHDAYLAERIGYWQIDRGVFELIAPRQEVTDVVEQRLPLARPHDGQQLPLGQEIPAGPGRPSGVGPAGLDVGRTSRPFRSGVSMPAVDDAPLPLEAQAMRAASAAARRGSPDQAGRPPGRHASGDDAPGGLAALAAKATAIAEAAIAAEATTLAPAGVSEPTTAAAQGADSSMPSWTPHPHVPPQVPAQDETPGPPAAPTGKLPEAGPKSEPLPAGVSQPAMVNGAAHDRRVMPVGVALAAPLPAVERVPAPQHDRDVARVEPPASTTPAAVPFESEPGESELATEPAEQSATRRRRASRRRQPTQRLFSELAAQAAIPAGAYAIGEDIDGAMCLIKTSEGFEVFNSLGGARHEVRVFNDEESAYFYLFGVLVADAVRTGLLAPRA
jgi:hypothetical protein